MKISKYLLIIPAGVLFGKLLPVIFLAAIIIGLVIIFKAMLSEVNE